MKMFIPLSGIPRSGSTVLTSLLNQHPLIHASGTSPIIDILQLIHSNWIQMTMEELSQHPKRLENILKGVLNGGYQHIDKKVIIDKNRLWGRHSSLLTTLVGDNPKLICTVRPIPEVLASFVMLLNNTPNNYVDNDIIEQRLTINSKNRCKILWEKYIIHPYTSFRIAYNTEKCNIHLVDYENIVNNSQKTIDSICEFIGIETFTISDNNLIPMDENDNFHGGLRGLHHVRPELKRISLPAASIIGNDMVRYYNSLDLEFWQK